MPSELTEEIVFKRLVSFKGKEKLRSDKDNELIAETVRVIGAKNKSGQMASTNRAPLLVTLFEEAWTNANLVR